MPFNTNRLQRAAVAAFHRRPAIERLTLSALDACYRIALLPFRRGRITGVPHERQDLVAQTDAYNAAAEEYFATFQNPEFLLRKPFSETHAAARHLIDAGVLIDAMRLQPGDVVVEIGAGSCWLSQMLNRYGCRTIAVDVSPTALALGKRLFEADSRTDWTLNPLFLAYDGHSLPIETASCDRVVINDAFHHIPNQRELLIEMHRILKSDGAVAMSEPGMGHGAADQSAAERAHAPVLENELDLDDVAALAEACGFRQVNVVVAGTSSRSQIPASELGAFMGGKGFAAYWKALCTDLEQHHYILCYKGSAAPTSERPSRLLARIETIAPAGVLPVRVGEAYPLRLRITNIGDTRWLARPAPGWTRVGIHLYADGRGEALDFDWVRFNLPDDVEPGEVIAIDVNLPPISKPGRYFCVIDLVVEELAWFADRGSQTARVTLDVR